MTSDPRRTSIGAQRNPESRDAILKAATDIITESGLAGFSIEAVARRARAGKPTIYRWWPSRGALLLAIYELQKPDLKMPDTGALEEDIFLFLKGLIGHWRDTPAGAIYRSILAEAQSNDASARVVGDYTAGRYHWIGEILTRNKARGTLADDVDANMAGEQIASFAIARLVMHRLAISDSELRLAARQFAQGLRKR
ncbi:transcriptional regulator, TetR family [Rhizobium sp. RU35A]|uniref:TetR/AcrR family transcriptional regulator n=1 Tax=Rhizobium straminoryzae TaxID=1387186 RepID=A0A549T3P1_9HYPH|nr:MULTISPECIES: TetR/AcrR family transcriptional regulator [Rhizobium]TRL36501.1 TetR/AcrR family transcriptional regulator [Rhizobium straminoryzae]SIR07641.1 transcriptional regulator, TetR family [Rhizobium sp. RU35A]